MGESQVHIFSRGGVHWWRISLTMLCLTISVSAGAATLPKGQCADPKPYTDLKHCRYKKADLKNKDLRGTDLRGILFYQTQLQGANLTNALIDGRYISYAFLDGVIGLPAEALVLLKTSYLAKSSVNGEFEISPLPSNYQGSPEGIAGLDNIFLAQKIAGTQSTIALLSNPKYGDYQKSLIVAKFNNDEFEFPACYRSLDLLHGDDYYYPHWSSMKLKALTNGDFLIGVGATGSDGDDMGSGGWEMVAFLKLTAACDLSLLKKENSTWSEDANHVGCRGEHLDYRFLDEQSAEIKRSAHTCTESSKSRSKVTRKKIALN